MNCSEEKAINDPKCQIPLGPTDATEPPVLTVNQDLGAPLELMEVERHGLRAGAPSLYRRGRQAER